MNVLNINEQKGSSFPYNGFYAENPFSSRNRIYSGRAGIIPIKYYSNYVVTKEEECPSQFQTSCDIILPKNLCWMRNREIIMPP